MKKIYFLLLVMLVSFSQAQDFRFKKGVIIKEVPMVTDSIGSYALYLPKDFQMNKTWPVLFAFDPAGDGERAATVFKEVAEQYGFIIVASNSIKNDLLEKNLPRFDKLSVEIAQTFPIQKTRVMLAGQSGGARLATTIAVITNKVEAVIACGASFSDKPDYYPTKPNFYFVGITGVYDFNNIEMEFAQEYLNRKKIPNELFVFDGGHEWPDAATVAKAFKWIEFRYQKKYNKLPKDTLLLQYKKDFDAASQLATYNKEAALRSLNRIYKNYKPQLKTDSLKKIIRNLKKAPDYKARVKKDWQAILEEDDLRNMYALYFREDLEALNFDNLAWWESQLQQIDSFTKSKEFFKKRTGKRLQSLLFTAAKEVSMTLTDATDTKKWLYTNIFMTLANKNYNQAYFNIIQYGAKKLDYDLALFYTDELFKNGFTDLETLYNIEGASLFFVLPDYLELEDFYFNQEKDEKEIE
jgi:pimeloyl-ACP methyl ester carboxylesterase